MSKDSGFYSLDKFRVTPMFSPKGEYGGGIELKRAVVTWTIDEAMGSSYLSGSAVVSESFDALKKTPLRGEEILEVEFTDFFDQKYQYTFYVYAVTDLEKDPNTNGKLMKYVLHFTTFQKLESDKTFVRKSFGEELVSTMADQVFERFFPGDKELETEETTSKQTLVIPRLRSDQAMIFLARRAYKESSPSSLYYFFENREKYYFASYEYLVEKYKPLVSSAEVAESNDLKFIFQTYDDNTPKGQRVAQFTVSNLTYIDRSNSLKAMKDGAYKRSVLEIDYYTRQAIPKLYDYLSKQEEHEVIDKLTKINTDDYVNTYMPDEEAPRVAYITDYNQIGLSQGKRFSLAPYRNYAETFFTKTIINYHLNNSSISCTIKGQGKLMPGMMIWLEVYDFAENAEGIKLDQERSGPYLVMSVSNVFSGDQYVQKLSLTKGGLREV